SDPEEDPIDYPADRGDDDDDDDESSDDDEDDDDDVEENEEGEEDHPALVDSVPPPVHRITARTSIQDEPPTPFWSEIPSPPLPVSSPVLVLPPPLPASPTYPLGYRATMIWQRAETPSTSYPLSLSTPSLLPIPLPTLSPPLLLPSTDCRAGVFEDTDEIYGRLDDAQDDRERLDFLVRLGDDRWMLVTPPILRLIDQGVANALAARDADRSRNGEDSHDLGTGVRRQV
ncbi:hypothetical protein Tco_1488775, partial [Tanacetum coccineum]